MKDLSEVRAVVAAKGEDGKDHFSAGGSPARQASSNPPSSEKMPGRPISSINSASCPSTFHCSCPAAPIQPLLLRATFRRPHRPLGALFAAAERFKDRGKGFYAEPDAPLATPTGAPA